MERVLTSRSEEHTSELQSRQYLVCRLLLEKKKKRNITWISPTNEKLVAHVVARVRTHCWPCLASASTSDASARCFLFQCLSFFFLNNAGPTEIPPLPPPAPLPI